MHLVGDTAKLRLPCLHPQPTISKANERIAMKKLIIILTLNLAGAVAAFAAPNPERDAYFGTTHVHTSWSLDAFSLGNMLTTPGDAIQNFPK
jgi:hypothetical protein